MTPSANASATGIRINHTSGAYKFIQYDSSLDLNYQEQREKLRFSKNPNGYQQDILALNAVQESMFLRLTKKYDKEDLRCMPVNTRRKITKDYESAQFIIRKFILDEHYHLENKLINAMFPHVEIGSKISDYFFKTRIPTGVTLTSVGISKRQLISEFISKNLLPKDFFELSVENLSL
jgi:hypothetical protein